MRNALMLKEDDSRRRLGRQCVKGPDPYSRLAIKVRRRAILERGVKRFSGCSGKEPLTIIGLAAAILALGSVHRLVRDQDLKDAAAQERGGTAK